MQEQNNTSNDLLRYAGLGGQILVAIGIAVFAGLKLDKWIHLPFPLLVWLLPLAALILMIYKLIKDTSTKK